MAEVQLKNLSYRYPGATAATLTQLNLQVAAGEAHALLGSSGAGKSTLLNLLSGLLQGEEGELLLGGVELRQLPPAARGISQVFQFPVLYESMTVLENLAFPLQALKFKRAQRQARARTIAQQLELEALLGKRPGNLSLYEKQLVSIGKALVRPDVSLVLLDEPLTAAEPARKWRLRQTLKALQRESGATMIYVTHDQTEALTFADRISVMHDGRILQTGSAAQLLDSPVHRHVGHFVGSPGMNFLPAPAGIGTAAAEDDRLLGFRPEWACIGGNSESGSAQLTLTAKVQARRILGTHRGEPFGLVEAEVGGQQIITRQPLGALEEGPGQLRITRYQLFEDGWVVNA